MYYYFCISCLVFPCWSRKLKYSFAWLKWYTDNKSVHMLNSRFCTSTAFSSPLLSWGMTMEESSGLNQDRENVSDFIHFFLKKYIHMIVYEHMETLRCVCVYVRELCMFIGLVVHVIICVWSGWCFFVFTWSFFDSIWLDNSKTWTWMWSSRLPAHTAAAEQLQCLALKTAASLLP